MSTECVHIRDLIWLQWKPKLWSTGIISICRWTCKFGQAAAKFVQFTLRVNENVNSSFSPDLPCFTSAQLLDDCRAADVVAPPCAATLPRPVYESSFRASKKEYETSRTRAGRRRCCVVLVCRFCLIRVVCAMCVFRFRLCLQASFQRLQISSAAEVNMAALSKKNPGKGNGAVPCLRMPSYIFYID